MIVAEPDKFLLHGDFDDTDGISPERIWLTRYFSKGEGWRFVIYYLKMYRLLEERGLKNFITLYLQHTGSVCYRKRLSRWCRMFARLEKLAIDAFARHDLEELSELKSGRFRHKKKGKS